MASNDKKLVRSKSGLRIVSLHDGSISPLYLKEPNWTPDKQHHCRRCGLCFCAHCCDSQTPLPRMFFVDPVRQCEACSHISVKENDFFDRHLPVLLNGCAFLVSCNEINSNSCVFHCRFTTDSRCLKLESTEKDLEPVNLNRLKGVQILTNGFDSFGKPRASGLQVNYLDDAEEAMTLTLKVTDDINEVKKGMAFIGAMQRALKLIYEKDEAEAT